MHPPETQDRFVELRVQGWTYRRLEAELKVSRPTLIAWSRKHQHLIENLRAIEREHLADNILASGAARLEALGEQLRAAEAELGKRDLTTLSTGRLLSHVESLRRQILRETGTMKFVSAVDHIPEDEYADRIQVWKP
jgi:hypothetical protein